VNASVDFPAPTHGGPVTPPFFAHEAIVIDKQQLRKSLRKLRREHVDALPDVTRRLLFMRPPTPVAALIPEGSMVSLYFAAPQEAPTRAYAQWLYENGRRIALPWFADKESPMQFREWRDPWDDEGLEDGPYGTQPDNNAALVTPDVLFVPLLGFTARCERLGQGAGHYDRWLAANPAALPLGLAWDCQLTEQLPTEPHDIHLRGVITPTRFYEAHDA
jgi:5-formyltetrahydrofolate cyclo-ligase